METVERNWGDLPTELLHLIAKKLPDISDFIRSRAVCKPWRSSISVSDPPPLFPWIINGSEGPNLEFYSLCSNKVYTIHAPNSSDKKLFGPARGYMLAIQSGNGDQFSLLNPLNNSEICLPVQDGSGDDVFWIGPQNFQSNDCVAFIDFPFRLVVCKVGDDRWDSIGSNPLKRYFKLRSLLFQVDDHNNGDTKVMDIGSHKETYVIPPPKYEKSSKFSDSDPYLVESCGDIFRFCHWRSSNMAEYEFEIHLLEFGIGEGHPCWVKVRSIGDQVLFFDFPASCGFGVKVNDYFGFKGNYIYFIDRVGEAYVIGMYNIQSRSTMFIDCPFDCKDITWFVPTLNHI